MTSPSDLAPFIFRDFDDSAEFSIEVRIRDMPVKSCGLASFKFTAKSIEDAVGFLGEVESYVRKREAQ